MNVQAAPSPFEAMSSNQVPTENAPVLGTPVPGTTGGLPAQSGLSVLANPMAEQLRNMGRGEDTMLVHMTPNEVNSLQGLAQAAGGSLTINPDTGLPEASFLKKLLPTLLGVGLNFILPGSGIVASLGGKAATAGLLTAAGTTALTGSLQKGLAAGLGAFGGASLAGGIQGALSGAAPTSGAAAATPPAGALPARVPTLPGPNLTGMPAARAASAFSPSQAMGVSSQLAGAPAMPAALGGGAAPLPTLAAPAARAALPAALGVNTAPLPTLPADLAARASAAPAAQRGLGGFMQGFSNTARGTMSGLGASLATPMAASGVLGTVSSLATPSGGRMDSRGAVDNSYQGPYYAQQRRPQFAESTADILGSSRERDYFNVDVPEIYNVSGQLVQPGTTTAPGTPIYQNVLNPRARRGQPMYTQRVVPYMGLEQEEDRFAEGGTVRLADGAFVVDARTVSELGNGSSNAGHEILSRLGGRPIRGPGDGVSDSVPARIGRDQPARVARDEVVFSPEAVRRMGRGNEQRGAQRLYSLMEKAHKARRQSARGKDTNVRRGLA